nr:uncharacterized protein LOC118681010 [Bactrocera oleae]
MFIKYLALFRKKMDKLKLNVTGLRNDLNKFTEQNNKTAQQQKLMGNRIDKIEKQLQSISNLNGDPNFIISELNERMKRESEVVIYNVPESKKPAGLDRRNDNIEQVAALITEDLSNKIPDIKVRRLGKPVQGKTRPVLLYTPSPATAREVIKINPAGDTGIKFKPSLTHAQQQHLNMLRTELNELIKGGDNKRTIKYINGVPKIVDKPAFQTPREKNKEILLQWRYNLR